MLQIFKIECPMMSMLLTEQLIQDLQFVYIEQALSDFHLIDFFNLASRAEVIAAALLFTVDNPFCE